eukprot:g493.t1
MEALAARVQRLEDIEEIKQLKAAYCRFCDDGYDPDGIASLFTDDGIWAGGDTFGHAETKEGIRKFFTGAHKGIPIARHQVMNPIIEVDGDTAKGHWLLFQPMEQKKKGALWLAATYSDKYARTAEGWRIKHLSIDIAFFTQYDKGWANQRFHNKSRL